MARFATRDETDARSEFAKTGTSLIAGKAVVSVTANVSKPTVTVYAPSGKNTEAAVVVFPGGGFQILAVDLEGTEVCDWLTSRGIVCITEVSRCLVNSTPLAMR